MIPIWVLAGCLYAAPILAVLLVLAVVLVADANHERDEAQRALRERTDDIAVLHRSLCAERRGHHETYDRLVAASAENDLLGSLLADQAVRRFEAEGGHR